MTHNLVVSSFVPSSVVPKIISLILPCSNQLTLSEPSSNFFLIDPFISSFQLYQNFLSILIKSAEIV